LEEERKAERLDDYPFSGDRNVKGRRSPKPIPLPWEVIVGFKEYQDQIVIVTREGRKLRFSAEEFYLDLPR